MNPFNSPLFENKLQVDEAASRQNVKSREGRGTTTMRTKQQVKNMVIYCRILIAICLQILILNLYHWNAFVVIYLQPFRCCYAGKTNRGLRLSIVDLLVLTGLKQLLCILKILVTFNRTIYLYQQVNCIFHSVRLS